MRALLPLLLVVTGCASGADTVASSPTTAPTPEPATRLQVELVPEPGAEPRRWTLTCSPPGGDHPDPQQACADLEQAQAPFAPLDDAVCTEQYGGPQTAVVQGTYQGEPVSLQLSRTNGCEIAQWDRLGAVLPAGS